MSALLEEKKLETTIKRLQKGTFTVIDFIGVFRKSYRDDWARLVKRFGKFGEKRRYTVTTYLSNRLDLYSQKPGSILCPFTRFRDGKFKDYRKTTVRERRRFGSRWIAVFRKKR